jgi:hypothetical protein
VILLWAICRWGRPRTSPANRSMGLRRSWQLCRSGREPGAPRGPANRGRAVRLDPVDGQEMRMDLDRCALADFRRDSRRPPRRDPPDRSRGSGSFSWPSASRGEVKPLGINTKSCITRYSCRESSRSSVPSCQLLRINCYSFHPISCFTPFTFAKHTFLAEFHFDIQSSLAKPREASLLQCPTALLALRPTPLRWPSVPHPEPSAFSKMRIRSLSPSGCSFFITAPFQFPFPYCKSGDPAAEGRLPSPPNAVCRGAALCAAEKQSRMAADARVITLCPLPRRSRTKSRTPNLPVRVSCGGLRCLES